MRYKIYHIALGFLLSLPLFSQTQVEVITKTVKDRLDYVAGYTVEVEGKSANITILSWEKSQIVVEMKLISKGLTREIAEKELAFQKYVIDEVNETFVIRNYLLLPRGLEKLTTIQETEMTIYLPAEVNVTVNNLFGNTTLSDFSGKLEIDSQYGEVRLAKTSGTVRVKSVFGDLFVDDFEGALIADLEHTVSQIDRFSGNAYIKSQLGDVRFVDIEQVTRLKVIAEKSDIRLAFLQWDLNAYYWQLKTKYGEIAFPRQQAEEKKISLGNEKNPTIELFSDFGTITIEE